jgi:ribosome maturation factor RimP
MIAKDKILALAQEHLDGSAQFLVDLKVSADNQISIYIDGDENVSIDECVDLSRHIEFSLDRETEDFALSVSSAGLDMPLKFLRQYPKYIGKKMHVHLVTNELIFGQLEEVGENTIQIIPLTKNPNAKKGTSKQFIEGEPKTIKVEQIVESKLEITF